MQYSTQSPGGYALVESGILALLARQQELRGQLEALDPDDDHEMDGARGMDDVVVQQRQSAAAVLSILQTELRQVERALDRAAGGFYGACEDCGGTIAPRRLQVVPAATRCVACQECQERRETRSED